jgi:transcriptional regulator with XRE-family HTH domain
MKNVKTNVNERVEILRKRMGLTQQQFADLCRLTNTTIHRLEKGGNEPQQSTLSSIITGTGVNDKWLLEGEGELTFVKKAEKPESDSPWRDEAYANLKQEKEYFKRNYEKLLEILLSGKKPENLNFLKASEYAGPLFYENIGLSEARA